MSNKGKIIFIIIAGLVLVAVGVFASMILLQSYQTNQATEEDEVETIKTTVIVLTRDLSLGDNIGETDVQLADVPVEIAPRNAITTLEEAIGKMVKTDMVQGEMILSHNLAEPTTNNKDLNYILSDNHVLMAFPATDLMSQEGMVQRGDIVDIFATFEQVFESEEEPAPAGEGEEEQMIESRTFTVDTMQKVRITAMVLDIVGNQQAAAANPLGGGQQAEETPDAHINAYLLALDPQSALVLKHLKDTGAIFDIVLRAPTSTIEHELTPVSENYIRELYGLEILP